MIRRVILFALLLVGTGIWWTTSTKPSGLSLSVLDVGQGDSILVRTPNGTDVLVDTGRGRAAADGLGKVLPPGDNRLELLVLTHPDADHIGGTPAVLDHYGVDRVWVSGAVSDTATDRAVRAALQQRSLSPQEVITGDALNTTDGTRFEVLWPRMHPGSIPPAKASAGHGGTNDSSIVIRVTYQTFCALLTADASDAVEQQLLDAGALTSCAVLKVGHHGSRYSSSDAFLAALHPQLALVSVGKKNSYGHPAPAALRRLERSGATILRTDQLGTITVRYDGTIHIATQRRGT